MPDGFLGLAAADCDITEAGMPVRSVPLVSVPYKSEEIAPPFGIDHGVSLLLSLLWMGVFMSKRKASGVE
jgi:hypothetical protein